MKSLIAISVPVVLLAAGAAGCVDSEAGDGIDDSFLADGKADAFGVAEGSPDALAVLSMLRTATLEQLDGDAGLSASAAKAIIHHRQGGDRKDGTADDDVIDSLKELDAIPYVGPMAFRLLLDYARTTIPVGSNDPFDPTYCANDFALTMGSIKGALNGQTNARFQTTQAGIRVRTRTCVTPDNCPAWVEGSVSNMFGSDAKAGNISIPAAGLDPIVGMQIAGDGRPVVVFESSVQVAGSTPTTARMDVEVFPSAAVAGDNDAVTFDGNAMTLDDQPMGLAGMDGGSTVLVGGNCAQLVYRMTDNGGATHREVAIFARY